MNNLSIYDSCIESGFNVTQSRKLVELFDHQEKTAFQSVETIKDDIRNINNNIIILQSTDMQLSVKIDALDKKIDSNTKLLLNMIGIVGGLISGLMICGFGVMGWLIKG